MIKVLIFFLLLFPIAASAHYGNGLLHFHDGFIHPLTGWDHILAAVAVGIWATGEKNRIHLSVPVLFLMTMIAGILVGMAGVSIPFVEQGILLSIAILGWILLTEHAPSRWNLLAICYFGFVHGNAHGVEEQTAALGGVAGLIAATTLLHLSGIGFVLAMKTTIRDSAARKWIRGLGAGMISVALIVGMIGA